MSTDTQTVEETRPTNASVGEKLGITHAHVSRLRYGQRLPSFNLMSRIETLTDWKFSAQASARQDGSYAKGFRKAFDLPDDRESE